MLMLNFKNITVPLKIKAVHDKCHIADRYEIVEKVAKIFMEKFTGLGLLPVERDDWMSPSETKITETKLLKNLRGHCSSKYIFAVFFTEKSLLDQNKNISRRLNACVVTPDVKHPAKTIAYYLAQALGARQSSRRASLMNSSELNAFSEIYFNTNEENAINKTVRKRAYKY